MEFDIHSLFGYSTVVSITSQAGDVIVFSVEAGQGSYFSIGQQIVFCPPNQRPLFSNAMVARITDISGDDITASYAVADREGSSERTVLEDDQVFNAYTPKVLTDIETNLKARGNNFLVNSAFEVCASWGTYILLGSAVSCTSYTLGGNSVKCLTSDTQGLVAGKLIEVAAGADASLTNTLHLVTEVVENVSVTFILDQDTISAGAGGAITIQEAVPGNAGTGTGNAYTGWKKTGTLHTWRQQDTFVKDGAFYSAALKKGAGTAEVMYQDLNQEPGAPANKQYHMAKFAGRTVVFGAWVYPTTANAIRLYIQDDTGSTYSDYAPANEWTWLEVSTTFPTYDSFTIGRVGVSFEGLANDIAYVSQSRLDYGTILGEGNYIRPIDEYVTVISHVTPPNYEGGSISAHGSKYFEMEGESFGIIPKTAKLIRTALEAKSATAGNGVTMMNQGGYNFNIKCYSPFDSNLNDVTDFFRQATAQGSAAVSATQSKFGGKSLSLNGSTQSIYYPDSPDFYFGDLPFSIDLWVYFNSLPTNGNYMTFCSQRDGDPTRLWFCIFNNAGVYNVYIFANGSAVASKVITPVTGSWHHFGAFRGWGGNDDSWAVTYDGVAGTPVTSAITVPDQTSNFYLGQIASGAWLDGYIDEFIVSKGSARYTANFTPATAALSANPLLAAGILLCNVANLTHSIQLDIPVKDGKIYFRKVTTTTYDALTGVSFDMQEIKI